VTWRRFEWRRFCYPKRQKGQRSQRYGVLIDDGDFLFFFGPGKAQGSMISRFLEWEVCAATYDQSKVRPKNAA